MKTFITFAEIILALAIPVALFGQTKPSVVPHSYLMPGDSLYYDLSLKKGDVLEWNLWLAPAMESTEKTVLEFVSDVDGLLWKRSFGRKALDLRDKIKIINEARYRMTLKTTGQRGRIADLSVWTKLKASHRTPFPSPGVQRFAENFSSGDQFSVEYEFLLPKSISFQKLLGLELSQDLVHLWAITPLGDSLPATASVKRWFGEAGILSLRERTPYGGRITLRLELDVADDGESILFLAPGEPPPDWLPSKARMLITRKHDPWKGIIVPPVTAMAETLAARPAELPHAPYAEQSLRARGLDSVTVAELTEIYIERDSLSTVRHARRSIIEGYDTEFLTAKKAFLPPDLHVVLTTPLTEHHLEKRISGRTRLEWFVEGDKKQIRHAKLYEWRYTEAHIARADVPDEFFWDNRMLPLYPDLKKHTAATPKSPATITSLPLPDPRPSTFVQFGREYIDDSQSVLALYLENNSEDTLYLVYHQARLPKRTLFSALSRWPKGARWAAIILGVFGLAGVAAIVELRRRERKRRKRAEEFEVELEKARQVQLKLLPEGPMEAQGLQVYGLHQSMQSVGGDYYDFFALEDGRVMLCVADVAGHGLSAALLMSNVQATLRLIAQPGRQLTEIVSLLNHEICQRTSPERFVTFLLVEISADRSLITICNAGHNPGYIVRTSGNIVELDAGGVMLGFMDVFPFIQVEHGLDPGDLIVLYTDGIPEAEIGYQDMFGYERLKYYLQNHRTENLMNIAQGLLRRVTSEDTHTIEDDMAIVLARIGTKSRREPSSKKKIKTS